ncbi:alpha/beta fold hydrolase [Arthrobacter sp. ES3-54]|uniref:alpha/beta fold hydrolase n=1 Tax=Arthrobacter sp. ES3-54 TaxID=1502991 RepID=UPI00240491D6|nr:alpha/beta fold hydrolase [Arthrobacter sp. ES3-54]MDF9751634.1 pimeloyl-ACP methyl ester carboxylesterase [Arthrobacter sp. ES3-54]
MDTVEVAGLRIRYQRAGQGPPLVLLHGAYEDSRIWRRQLDGLSDEYTVFAWDAPGCGGSDDPQPDFTGKDLADALAGFLLEAVPGRPHILGLSMGSGIALEFYRAYPSVPASLLLASAYAGWAGSLPPEEVERRYEQVLAELEQPPEQFIPAWLPTLFTDRADPEAVQETSAIMADFHPSGMRALLNANAHADYRDVLPTIAVPTLLLYGTEDVRSRPSVAREMNRRIPGSTLVMIPDVGHMGAVEAPDAFNAEVRRFLRGVTAG